MAFAYTEQATWSGKRFLALLGAIAVNLGFILALSNGLNFQIDKIVVPPIVAEFIDDPPAEQQPMEVPPPEIPIVIETPSQIAATSEPQPITTPTPPPTQLQADRALTPPIYPATSRKLEEEGTVMLMIYVLPDGRVGDVRVARSSGYPRLDEAAMTAARKGWRFRPATSGGGPVAAWGRYAVTFSLKD